MQQLSLIQTQDGSHTLYNSALDEHYHSVNGAINESLHVFIKNGLEYRNTSPSNILEIGFGTGLNALLSYHYALEKRIQINYHSVELYPIGQELIDSLNYSEILGPSYLPMFNAIHKADWNTTIELNQLFFLNKINDSIHSTIFNSTFDIVYFDAFAPDKQPDMWELSVFKKIFALMNPNSVLVTYCAKGAVRRTLKAAGFKIEKLPGPAGKREMTRAFKH